MGEDRISGLLTGYKVKNLETGEMLLTVNYYDKKGQIIQAKNKNHLGGTDVVDNAYNFSGELTKSTLTHQLNNNKTTIANRYEYDHVGRRIANFQRINEQVEVGINHLVYNEIGQVIEKRLHNDLQTTRLSYNERGWLKRSVSNEFSFKLKYEDGTSKGYNGNISRQLWDWGNNQNPSNNVFNYEYDKLSRLTLAETAAGLMTERIAYDEMGNIKNLSRDGSVMNEYHYDGNQLKSIDNVTSQSYVYDNNGNAKKDGRNGMSYTYNYLDLPEKASKNSDSVIYIYDAMGQKLKKTSVFNGIANTRDYDGAIEYNNGVIELIHTEEGIAQRNGSNNYTYNYNLTDHLGNVRLTFDVYNNSVHPLQKDDYYAFGLRKSAGLVGSNDNKYLYNGKEIQEELEASMIMVPGSTILLQVDGMRLMPGLKTIQGIHLIIMDLTIL
ncbi:hypothetical protein SAMN05421827_1255 [Pedobacter terrae]|uniref:Teneurin-like YD-shell domain-containing protein n=1 Tax=Pedobacter terrae TaxID=405671 RepID=A0A1G8CHX0_9SPHI|nr:hypothetical protein SAMN05421827_1255 [Pedobacter terrae]